MPSIASSVFILASRLEYGHSGIWSSSGYFGTLYSSLLGLLIAVPLSLGAAIFLVELAPPWIRGPGSFLIEMLAAIPSVIIGLWGLYVLVPVIRTPIETWLGTHLGFLPFFQGPPFGLGFLAAGVILAIMIIHLTAKADARAVPILGRRYGAGVHPLEMISRSLFILPVRTSQGRNPGSAGRSVRPWLSVW
jgi:ABC-type phosphate transport system permease subunit